MPLRSRDQRRLRVVVVDPRRRFADPLRSPHATEVVALWPQHAFAGPVKVGLGTAVVALSHEPKLDDEALIASLATPAHFVERSVHAAPPPTGANALRRPE